MTVDDPDEGDVAGLEEGYVTAAGDAAAADDASAAEGAAAGGDVAAVEMATEMMSAKMLAVNASTPTRIENFFMRGASLQP